LISSADLTKKVKLKDGTRILLRPEVASDLESIWDMYRTLSSESLSYLPTPIVRETVEGWIRNLNYESVLPILAVHRTEEKERVAGAATLIFYKDEVNRHKAVFGIVIHDDYQNLGLGTHLTGMMVEVARVKGLKKVCLDVVSDNKRAIRVYEKCGFSIEGLHVMDHYNVHRGCYGDDYRMAILL
jgi:RimJ/RimL family protein N-acetyltransferase